MAFLNVDLFNDNAALNKPHKWPIVKMGLLEQSSSFFTALQTFFSFSDKSSKQTENFKRMSCKNKCATKTILSVFLCLCVSPAACLSQAKRGQTRQAQSQRTCR